MADQVSNVEGLVGPPVAYKLGIKDMYSVKIVGLYLPLRKAVEVTTA